jgi:tetratricopeptide (TPR) repeat protein
MFQFFQKRREVKYAKHRELAANLWSQGAKKGAIWELEAGLNLRPDTVEGWCQLGDWCDSLGSQLMMEANAEADAYRQKAITALKQAIKLQLNLARTHYMLGNIYWGDSFRKGLEEYRLAAQYDPEYKAALDRVEKVISGCNYSLGKIKVVHLASLREEPAPQIYETDFYFEAGPIGCVMMHTCVSGSQRQWAHGWLFESEEPDPFKERPVGELAISSTGDASASSGCPSNYQAVLAQLRKQNYL